MLGGLLFMITGFIIGFALFTQLISADLGGTQIDIIGLLLLFFFSYASYTSFSTFRDIQRNYVLKGDEKIGNLSLLSADSLSRITFTLVSAIVGFSLFWVLSKNLGEYSIYTVYMEMENGEANILDLILSGLYQLIYAGSIVIIISVLAYTRYQSYPATMKVLVWISRIRLYTIQYLANENYSDQEAEIESSERCQMCWKKTLKADGGDEVFYCDFCSHPFSFSDKANTYINSYSQVSSIDSATESMDAADDD